MVFAILGYILSVVLVVPVILYLTSRHMTKSEYMNRIACQMIGVLLAMVICAVWICIKPSAWWVLLTIFVVLCCIAKIAVQIYRKNQ